MSPRKPSTVLHTPHLLLRRPTLAFALLSALWVVLLYSQTLSNPFVYDDLDTIVHNPSLPALHTLFDRFVLAPVAFTTDLHPASTANAGSTWRPLFWVSLALDRRLFGPSAPAFHATSLLLHWIDGLLLFTLLRRLRVHLAVAAVSSLLWLALPINSEAVAWASARGYPLCLLFLLVALHAALTFLRTAQPLALAATAAASVAALLSNETALLLPALTLLLLDFPKPPSSRPEPQSPATNQTALRTSTLLLTLLSTDTLFLVARHHLHTSTGATSTPTFWVIAPTFWRYLGWILLPLHMSVERSTSTPPNLPTPSALLALAGLLGLLATLVLLRRRLPLAAGGLALTILTVLPFCGFVPLYQGMAERFLYIPSIGIALTLTALALRFAPTTRRSTLVALALFTLWNALRLHARLLDWSDPALLYQSSLAANPQSPTLYFNLAFTARERGDLLTAREDYLRSTELQPNFERAFASLGDIDARLNHPDLAIQSFQRALALNPTDAPTTTALALALQAAGNLPAAEQTFLRAIALDPADPTAHTDLAVLLSETGRTDAAIQQFQKAIALKPDDTTPYFDLGTMFQQLQQDDVALAFYRKVLDLKPDDPDTLLHISQLHTQHPKL